jgi:hypothetical protein
MESGKTRWPMIRVFSNLLWTSVTHPFRVFLRNGWVTFKIPVYTIPKNSLVFVVFHSSSKKRSMDGAQIHSRWVGEGGGRLK